jgi:hypothetical protein
MADNKYVEVLLDRPRRLVFRHKDLRDAVNTSKRSIGDLMGDPFGGWPVLLQHGLRHKDTSLSLDDCSEMIERWVQAGTNDGQTPVQALRNLSDKLTRALENTGFIKIERPEDEVSAADPT